MSGVSNASPRVKYRAVDPIESPWCLDLAPDPVDVRRARRLATAFARHEELDGVREALVLVTSELVSNALRAAESTITVTLTRSDASVRVEVADDGPGAPRLQHPDITSETGRGLMIVDGLAHEWGTQRAARGKVVWAELMATD